MGSMREHGLLLIALLVAGFSATFVVGLLKPVSILTLSSSVKGVNVELYCDSSCTQPLESIDWGICKPGTKLTSTIYIKNSDMKTLSMTLRTMNKASIVSDDSLILTWDKEGTTLSAGETMSAVFELNISEAISKLSEVNCDFTIAGEN